MLFISTLNDNPQGDNIGLQRTPMVARETDDGSLVLKKDSARNIGRAVNFSEAFRHIVTTTSTRRYHRILQTFEVSFAPLLEHTPGFQEKASLVGARIPVEQYA